MFRMSSKKNAEFSIGYVNRILGHGIGNAMKIEHLRKNWDGLIQKNAEYTTKELSTPKVISEETVQSLIKSVNK